MGKRLQAFLLACFVVVLWSASPPLTKLALDQYTPLQITAIRYSGAFLALLPLVFLRSRPTLQKLAPKDWALLALMGLLAFSLGNTILFTGLRTLPATTTAFLLNGIPIATVLLGGLFLGERPRPLQWGGILLAVLGGLLFFGWRIELTQQGAIAWSLLGVFFITLYGVLARSMTRSGRIDPLSLAAFPMGFGSLFLIGFTWPLAIPTWQVFGILAWLTLVNSALGFVLWNYALKHMQAFEISVTGNLMPIGTALLAPLLIGEPNTANAWIGMLVSLVGVVLVGLGGNAESTDPTPG